MHLLIQGQSQLQQVVSPITTRNTDAKTKTHKLRYQRSRIYPVPSLHEIGSFRWDVVVPHAMETKGVRCLLCHKSPDSEECESFKGKSVGETKAFLTE